MSEYLKETAMTDHAVAPESGRNLWVRVVYMLLMVFAFHLCWSVMLVIAVFQLILAMVGEGPNDRLMSLGRSLGGYVGQITGFLTFASEEVPFPFSDWPSGERS
jgi:hypothetical protein